MGFLIEPTKNQKFFNSLKMQYLLFKRKASNILKRITNSKISSNDQYTIQGKANGKEHTDYYIENPLLQYALGNPSYCSVRVLHKNEEKNIYVYIGVVKGADNAIGMLQTDKPIEEILSSPQGNDLLTQILQKDYAEKQLQASWKEQGIVENEKDIRFFQPSFNLGNISSKHNYFEISSEITPEIKKLLETEKEKAGKIQERISEKDVLFKNGEMVIGNAYIERILNNKSNAKNYKGSNSRAVPYTYSNVKLLKQTDNSYFYIGKLSTGNNKKTNESKKIISLENNEMVYNNTVIELPKPLDVIITEYHLEINSAIGQAFSDDNLKSHTEALEDGTTYTYAGKIEQFETDGSYSLHTTEEKLSSEIISLIKDSSQKVNKKTIDFPNKHQDEPENH